MSYNTLETGPIKIPITPEDIQPIADFFPFIAALVIGWNVWQAVRYVLGVKKQFTRMNDY